MSKMHTKLIFILIMAISLTSCVGPDGKRKFGSDARKNPDNPELRVKNNLEQGRGFRMNDAFKTNRGVFEFASSNPLWRASLDVIDFMPLTSVNYSGGIIITDWYESENKDNESIKIAIRFRSNDIRSDALDINIFTRKCKDNLINCKYIDSNETIVTELRKEILKKATRYKKQDENK
jgi:hypothetical protein